MDVIENGGGSGEHEPRAETEAEATMDSVFAFEVEGGRWLYLRPRQTGVVDVYLLESEVLLQFGPKQRALPLDALPRPVLTIPADSVLAVADALRLAHRKSEGDQ
jgi:hypothetical protein